MGGKITQNVSLASYQMLDGSNTTMITTGLSKPLGQKSFVSGGVGISTNFHDDGKLVLEGNAGYSPNKNISLKTRVRSIHADGFNTTQVRESVTFKQKFNDKLSGYISPYDALKYDYNKSKFKNDLGIFAGVSYNLTKGVTLSGEAQYYNIQQGKLTPENLGANVILNVTF